MAAAQLPENMFCSPSDRKQERWWPVLLEIDDELHGISPPLNQDVFFCRNVVQIQDLSYRNDPFFGRLIDHNFGLGHSGSLIR